MQGSLLQIKGQEGKRYGGLCGLAAVALCPDLADLKIHMLPDHRAASAALPSLSPPWACTRFPLHPHVSPAGWNYWECATAEWGAQRMTPETKMVRGS